MQRFSKFRLLNLNPVYVFPMKKTGTLLFVLLLIQFFTCALPIGNQAISFFLPLHTLLETVSIVVSMMVFTLGWNTADRNTSGNIILLGALFFAVGVLDFLHTNSYLGMPDLITQNTTQKQLNFWLFARFISAAGLLWISLRPWNAFKSGATRLLCFISLLIMVAAIAWETLFHLDWFPTTFVSGAGLTNFKKNTEYIIILLNLATAGKLFIMMQKPQPFNIAMLFGALCTLAMSEFFFTFYTVMAGSYNILGHIYKVIAYLFIYQAIVINVIKEPYRLLELAKEKFQTIFDSVNDGIELISVDGFVIDMNRLSYERMGYSRDEVIGQPMTKFNKVDDPVKVKQNSELIARKGYASFESTRVHRDGSIIPIEVNALVIEIEGKKVHLGICRNITERKILENQLRENEQRVIANEKKIRQILETCPTAARITKNGTSKHSYYNSKYLEITNTDRETIDDFDPTLYYAPEVLAEITQRLQNGEVIIDKVVHLENQNDPQFGSKWVLASYFEIDYEGSPATLGWFHDISERIRLEKMKSEFISTVSHELRTPLTSISGALGLITKEVLGKIPTEAMKVIEIAHRNSLRLAYMINDLLDMEKLAAGKVSFDMRPHLLVDLIKLSIEDNSNYLSDRQIKLIFVEDPNNEQLQLQCDRQRFLQVLSNLISNAIKFSHANGTVEIAIQQNDGIRISVTDHGNGIPLEFQKSIFQKFAQADSSDTRQKGGTGLGLAITRELIERMGGKIGFNSSKGNGACFYIDFPLFRSQKLT